MPDVKADTAIVTRNIALNNPCLQESNLSRQCLEENNYKHDACTLYFENFKACKKFWNNVKRDRLSKGIQPSLPLPEERKKIKQEYMKEFHQK